MTSVYFPESRLFFLGEDSAEGSPRQNEETQGTEGERGGGVPVFRFTGVPVGGRGGSNWFIGAPCRGGIAFGSWAFLAWGRGSLASMVNVKEYISCYRWLMSRNIYISIGIYG